MFGAPRDDRGRANGSPWAAHRKPKSDNCCTALPPGGRVVTGLLKGCDWLSETVSHLKRLVTTPPPGVHWKFEHHSTLITYPLIPLPLSPGRGGGSSWLTFIFLLPSDRLALGFWAVHRKCKFPSLLCHPSNETQNSFHRANGKFFRASRYLLLYYFVTVLVIYCIIYSIIPSHRHHNIFASCYPLLCFIIVAEYYAFKLQNIIVLIYNCQITSL